MRSESYIQKKFSSLATLQSSFFGIGDFTDSVSNIAEVMGKAF
jgi:hypothetical protein